MYKKTITLLLVIAVCSLSVSAQKSTSANKYGGALNLGLGIGGYYGYYGYAGRTLPVIHIDYEFDVAKNFTLAPFLNFYSFSKSYYWGNKDNPYRYYNYHETVIPFGLKGTYYFDDFLGASSDWDFYLGGSLGTAVVNRSWDSGYKGDVNYYNHGRPLFLDAHLGAEYHFNNNIGAFLDLSNGISTVGIAIH